MKKKHEIKYRLNILHIIWSASFGGIERLVLDLARAQAKDPDLQVGIVCGKEVGEFLAEYKRAGISFHFLKLYKGLELAPKKYLCAFRLFKESDILHFHCFNPVLAVCAIFSGKKVVYTEHGNFGFGRKRTFFYYNNFLLKRIFLNNFVDYITFNSKFTKNISLKLYGISKVRNCIVYNGITILEDIKAMNDIEKSIFDETHGKFIVGLTSRFKRFKRVNRLIQAFSNFQRNKNTILLLVGDGNLRNELELLVQKLGLSEKVIFAGYRSNVRVYQDLMDVCVFPFKNESFGLVAIEALSLGKPAIVFKDGGGIAEIVGGFSRQDIVENEEQLIDRLEYYYFNQDEIIKKKLERISYARRFNNDEKIKEFSKIYQQIL